MDEIITSVVAGVIIAAVSGLAGILWQKVKAARTAETMETARRVKHDRLVDEALRILMLCRLEDCQDAMVTNHGIADNDAKLRAQRIYDVYHAMGGNGHGTQVNRDIQNAPIQQKEQ